MLEPAFFKRDTPTVARELLGCTLVRFFDGVEHRYMITETEAYDGPHDKASHAHKGRTPRTEVMFGPPGFWYVYFIYGIHWMLNIVTGPVDYPAAVLLRGVTGISGPARLTKALHITGELNKLPATRETGLWIEKGVAVDPKSITATPRIGVDYAGLEWAQKHLRFVYSE